MAANLEERALKVLGPAMTLPLQYSIARDEILALRKMGYTMDRIADFYGVSRMTIYRIMGQLTWDERIAEVREQSKRREKLWANAKNIDW